MLSGTIDTFDVDKGFGFIKLDNSNEKIFVYYTAIQNGDFKTITPGQVVHFLIMEGKKGPQAVNVELANI